MVHDDDEWTEFFEDLSSARAQLRDVEHALLVLKNHAILPGYLEMKLHHMYEFFRRLHLGSNLDMIEKCACWEVEQLGEF